MKGFKATKQTGYFYCDGCKQESDEPVFELMSEVRSTTGYHYRCRACALKRVSAQELQRAIKQGDEAGDRAKTRAQARERAKKEA